MRTCGPCARATSAPPGWSSAAPALARTVSIRPHRSTVALHEPGELRGIRHVARDAERVRAARDQVGGRALRLAVGEAGEHHPRARRGEGLGARAPDAGARARDDRDLARAREERARGRGGGERSGREPSIPRSGAARALGSSDAAITERRFPRADAAASVEARAATPPPARRTGADMTTTDTGLDGRTSSSPVPPGAGTRRGTAARRGRRAGDRDRHRGCRTRTRPARASSTGELDVSDEARAGGRSPPSSRPNSTANRCAASSTTRGSRHRTRLGETRASGLGSRARGQPDRPDARHPGAGSADGRAVVDRQHRLVGRAERPLSGRVHVEQVGSARAHARRGDRARAARHPGQHRASRASSRRR